MKKVPQDSPLIDKGNKNITKSGSSSDYLNNKDDKTSQKEDLNNINNMPKTSKQK